MCVQVSWAAHSQDAIFDLSSLTLLNSSHSVLISSAITDTATHSATFYINICHPLVQQDGIHCPLDAAVCRKDVANTYVVSRCDAVCKCRSLLFTNHSQTRSLYVHEEELDTYSLCKPDTYYSDSTVAIYL